MPQFSANIALNSRSKISIGFGSFLKTAKCHFDGTGYTQIICHRILNGDFNVIRGAF